MKQPNLYKNPKELIKWLNANRTKVALPSYTEES